MNTTHNPREAMEDEITMANDLIIELQEKIAAIEKSGVSWGAVAKIAAINAALAQAL